MPPIAMYDQDTHIGVNVPQAQSRVLQAQCLLPSSTSYSTRLAMLRDCIRSGRCLFRHIMEHMQSTAEQSAHPACSENQAVLQRVYRDVVDGIAVTLEALHRAASVTFCTTKPVTGMPILLPVCMPIYQQDTGKDRLVS